jgi:O-antigen ligase
MGPTGRSQIDQRINESVMQTTDFWGRVSLWQGSLKVVQNFPLFGVGLGAWPEVFPQYQLPPWSPNTVREAHNDYLQGLAELGSIGFGLLLWFFLAISLYLYRGLKNLSTKSALVYAALLSSLSVMALHECVDFNLQIPANAFLFTLFLAFALRVALKDGERESNDNTVVSLWKIVSLGLTGTAAFLLGIAALQQERLPYPYNLQAPTSIADARKVLFSYPAHASTHVHV